LAANNDTEQEDQRQMLWDNVWTADRLYNSAVDLGCKRIVFASSSAVYGRKKELPYRETDALEESDTPYAKSKLLLEKIFSFVYYPKPRYDAETVGLRFCNVYGPGENHKGKRASMIHQMVTKIYAGEPVKLFEPGDQKREWLYVKDAVELLICAATRPLPSRHEIYNAATGEPRTFNDVFAAVSQKIRSLEKARYSKGLPMLFTKEAQKAYIPMPKHLERTYQSSLQCSIEKAKKDFDWHPRSLEDGLTDWLSTL